VSVDGQSTENTLAVGSYFVFSVNDRHQIIMKHALLYLILLLIAATKLVAQPVNDDCVSATTISVAADEPTAIQTAGDTRGATKSTTPTTVCSTSSFADDVWYSFTTPSVIPSGGIIVKAYFNSFANPTDINTIGMAVYQNCDSLSTPLRCFSSTDPEENRLLLSPICLDTSAQYYVRVWSSGNSPEGTFQIGAFGREENFTTLWHETFDGGIEVNGWSTYGSCSEPDSNHNANWMYLPDGRIDKGSYIYAGAGINSESICDGAVGVDSDYNDNYGTDHFGIGPCPAPSQHILLSPEIDTRSWGSVPIYISWIQALRNFESTFLIAYRVRNDGEIWNTWDSIQVNTEFPTNGNFETDNIQQHFLANATGFDFIQIQFIYNANYYNWVIDDIKLKPALQYNEIKIHSAAHAPWATLPPEQAYPYYAGLGLKNIGFNPQTDIQIDHYIVNPLTTDTFYRAHQSLDTLLFSDHEVFILFPEPVTLPNESASYNSIFIAKQAEVAEGYGQIDQTRINLIPDVFAHENGFTRPVSVSRGVYTIGAPLSFGYGNVFYPQTDCEANSIIWGANNPEDLQGKTVNLNLIEWADLNVDQIAQVSERILVGSTTYTFSGSEEQNSLIESHLENTIAPSQPIVMKAGRTYFAMVEYTSYAFEDPQLFLLASDARDYTGAVVAADSAYARGLIDHPIYMSVMQFSPDGVIANIDFEVRDLNPNDYRIHFGDDIVPLVRIGSASLQSQDLGAVKSLVQVSPNPASTAITISYENQSIIRHTNLQLTDTSGKIFFQKNETSVLPGHTEKIDVSHLSPGSYMLSVTADQQSQTIPVIIIR
jgi:hypothetical protein